MCARIRVHVCMCAGVQRLAGDDTIRDRDLSKQLVVQQLLRVVDSFHTRAHADADFSRAQSACCERRQLQ